MAFFWKNEFFSKKSFFFIFLLCQPLGLWVPTRPPRHCGRVGTHHGGVRSNFRCLQSHLKKKTGKFKFCFLAKNAQKKRKKKKIVSGPLGNVKTYLDTKFQLIWPSNEARASRNHFFGIKWGFCVWSHYMLLNLCKNLATREALRASRFARFW